MFIPAITVALLAGLLVVLLRIDVGIHRSESQLARIAASMENPKTRLDSAANLATRPAAPEKPSYDEIAAAIVAARVALNAKKNVSRTQQASTMHKNAAMSGQAYDGKNNGLVDVFNEEIQTDRRNEP